MPHVIALNMNLSFCSQQVKRCEFQVTHCLNRPAVAPIRIDIKLRGFEPLLIFLDGRQSIAILRCKMLQRLRVSVHISKYLEEPSASLVRGFNSQVYEVLERRQNKDQKTWAQSWVQWLRIKFETDVPKSADRADLEQSITYFEEAIRKDATFAPAYVGLANIYDALGTIFVGAPPGEVRPKVINAARKALELDPSLAEAHVLLAGIYQERWEWSDAEAEYKKALELKPNDAVAHLGFANWLLCQGRTDEALAWSRHARELDPLGDIGISIGWILFQARRYDEAIRELRSVLAVHPDSASAHWFLGFALIGNGQPEEAISELEKTASIMHRSPGSLELLATAHAHAGHRAEALHLINELKQRRQSGYVPAGALINPYLALRDYDQAFAWFERAYREQSNILQFLKVHPFFDPVRQDPRFKDLLRRVGLD